MRAHVFSLIFAGILLAVSGGVGQAQPYGPPPSYGNGVQPLDRLLPGIRREHPGDFYDAEGPTYGPSGDPHYHLKWMTPDGRVIWYDADARNGRVLRMSPGRDSFDNHRPPSEYPPTYGRPYGSRYPSYGPAPYGRNFVPGPGYARPNGGFGGPDLGGPGFGGRGYGGGPGYGGGRDFGGGRGNWGGGRGGGRGRH